MNSKITNPQTPEFKRYSDYQHIKETFKPNFWISGHYNNGLKIDNAESGSTNHGLIELTGSGYVTNGTFHTLMVFSVLLKLIILTSFQQHYTKPIILSFLLPHKTLV